MATLVLSTVGQYFGGPVGSAIGAFVGQQIDQNILFKPKTREGPRLTDLAVQTSQYGRQVPALYGRMRVAGTVIWATDLKETLKKEGGGKGRASTRTYSYSVSFAVALSSRPVKSIGRIWAEGNLLRGAGGDFKTPVTFRFYDGYGDGPLDPLLASAETAGKMPSYRGTAYAVFEDMELAEYGNRIPSLTMEVIADNGAVTLHDVIAPYQSVSANSILPQSLTGFAASGSDVRALISAIDNAVPLSCAVSADGLRICEAMRLPPPTMTIQRADIAVTSQEETFRYTRAAANDAASDLALRYYDPARDYQTGLRHARHGQAGRTHAEIELAAVLDAGAAQGMADRLYRYRTNGQVMLQLAAAHIDEALTPGTLVRVEGESHIWRLANWQWREDRVLLELIRHSDGAGDGSAIEEQAGAIVAPTDELAAATIMYILDLPPFYGEPNIQPKRLAAVAGQGPAWRGARIFGVAGNGDLVDTGDIVQGQAVIGKAAQGLPPARPFIPDRANSIDIAVQHAGMELFGATSEQLSQGANLAKIGAEILQFGRAEYVAPLTYRLSCLWRGRGGTEHTIGEHGPDEPFILLDDNLVELSASTLAYSAYAAIGQGDDDPHLAAASADLVSVRPFAPVHLAGCLDPDDSLGLSWVRRSRDGYAWRDYVDVPLGEDEQCFSVTLVADGEALFTADTPDTRLGVDAAIIQAARANGYDALEISIRQKGRFTVSPDTRIAVTIA